MLKGSVKRNLQMEIKYSKNAIKNLSKMESKLRERIIKAIKILPNGDIIPLHNHNSAFRLRIGQYRVMFCQYENSIHIDEVLPRGSAYNK